ncbi:rRNA maturation RNase YbeY [Brevundimonas sp. A19_0]|uniref:rRNA maturation RNase YbeY n=1 Tax=Brevundimonas sp. A19_0 TaxID=2821087 RepID=UPI001ADA37A0|nr:rRNA maturation RNase YbeY [Brevundimonas sp. A19_0]MBO9501262.1 rRNA maturation RNase YbeY [Brevundimonas sp. A19_0]
MIEIQVEDPAWREALPDVEAVVRGAAEAVLGADPPGGGERATVLLEGDAAVRDLNARFRDRDAPTNVLSFPAAALPGEPETAPYLGDIILAFGVCAREAGEQGKPLAHHLSHLVIHGLLHLLGHDHQEDEEAEAMEARERTLLAGLGIDDPYRSIVDTAP